jgi:hypothetical protein
MNLNTTLPEVTDAGDILPTPENIAAHNIWYEEAHGFHIWNGNEYVEMNEGAIKSYLKTKKVRTNSVGGASAMDHTMTALRMKRNVAYVGPLAGRSAGLRTEAGRRMLVTGAPKLISPDASCDWSLTRSIIEGLLKTGGGVQVPYFYSWLKISLRALESGHYACGQALALVGPRDCGKTLLQTIIVAVLGGRTSNPYAYLSGETPFNRDLFRSECLCFGDEVGSTDIRMRRALGSKLKQMTVNMDQYCHGKGREAVTLRPQWRICFSLNAETENLMVLPPIDESLADKLTILRVNRAEVFNNQEKWLNDRDKDWTRIEAELGGLISFLHSYVIPEDIRSGRFGVTAYHDPDVLVALHAVSPESRLLDLIDSSDLFQTTTTSRTQCGMTTVRTDKEFWEGTHLELEKLLLSDTTDRHNRDAISRLLSFNSALGTYLGRLARLPDSRVEGRDVQKNSKKTTVWRIDRPDLPQRPKKPI